MDGPGSDEERRKKLQEQKVQSPLYYADYLRIKDLLSLQQPKTALAGAEAHDEHLFIVIHQVYELWFKQILHEIDSVRAIFKSVPVDERLMGVAVARLHRVTEIQEVLLAQVKVLETMSPIDFLDFRDYLYPASGFQSAQFRLVENKLGLTPQQRLSYGVKGGYCSYLAGPDAATVAAAEKEPSLHDLVEAWLERTPFVDSVVSDDSSAAAATAATAASDADSGVFTWWSHYSAAVEKMLAVDAEAITSMEGVPEEAKANSLAELSTTRDNFATLLDPAKYEASRKRGERRLSYRAVQAALLITLYHDEPMFQLPYKLLATLQDMDENLTAWRYRHALMVHRMLGVKMGTGGSSGYHYLRATAERHKVFNDLFNLSTFLIPRTSLPPLPTSVRAKLSFAYSTAPAATAAAHVPPRAATGEAATAVVEGHAAVHRLVTAATAPGSAPTGADAEAAASGAKCPFGHT